jgi:hypothetical protein
MRDLGKYSNEDVSGVLDALAVLKALQRGDRDGVAAMVDAMSEEEFHEFLLWVFALAARLLPLEDLEATTEIVRGSGVPT